jgi:hypothetical protein
MIMREGRIDWTYAVAAGLLGAMAGCVLWPVDAPVGAARRASVAGSILAILAVFPGIVAVVGLLFGIPAFLINRQVTGWPNRISRLGLGLGMVLTLVVIVASHVPLR